MQVAEQKENTHKVSDYSLCHGLTGICELLLSASDTLNESSYQSLAMDVGVRGINKYLESRRPWVCGLPEGEPLGLMLGLAGIGYYYLRLYNSAIVPSILMLTSH